MNEISLLESCNAKVGSTLCKVCSWNTSWSSYADTMWRESMAQPSPLWFSSVVGFWMGGPSCHPFIKPSHEQNCSTSSPSFFLCFFFSSFLFHYQYVSSIVSIAQFCYTFSWQLPFCNKILYETSTFWCVRERVCCQNFPVVGLNDDWLLICSTLKKIWGEACLFAESKSICCYISSYNEQFEFSLPVFFEYVSPVVHSVSCLMKSSHHCVDDQLRPQQGSYLSLPTGIKEVMVSGSHLQFLLNICLIIF